MELPCFRSIVKEKQWFLFVVIGAIYCYRPLFFDETFFYRDLHWHFIPQKRLLVELLKNGNLPLWDPYIHGGQPFLADVNNIALYPSNVLYLFLQLLTAFNLDLFIHFALYGVATYWLGRVIGLSKGASLLAGFIYQLCGFSLALMNFMNRYLASSLLPVMLLCWHLTILKRKPVWFAFAALAGSFQIFAGAPEMTILSLGMLLGWGIVYRDTGLSNKQLLLLWGILVFCICCISAIQILPLTDMLLQSSRKNLDYENFSMWSLHPKRLPEIIFPQFFGRTDALSELDYWGKSVEGVSYTGFLSIYFGASTLLLACIGAFGSILGRRQTVLFSALCLLGIVLAFGKFLPFWKPLYDYVPFARIFRFPLKTLAVVTLPLALLSAAGFQVLFSSQKVRKTTLAIFAGAALFALCFYCIFRFSNLFQRSLEMFFFSTFRENMTRGLQNSFFHAAAILILITLVILFRNIRVTAWQPHLFIMILVLDLFVAGKPLNPSAPRIYFEEIPVLAKIVKSKIATGKLFREESPAVVSLRAPSNDVLWKEVWYSETLNYYQAAFYGIPVVFHRDYDELAVQRLVQMNRFMEQFDWETRSRFLSAAGVSVVITDHDLSLPQFQKVAVLKNRSDLLFHVYRLKTYAAPVQFFSKTISVSSGKEALRAMLQKEFDATKTIVVETTSRGNPTGCNNAELRPILKEVNTERLKLTAPCDGYLYFSQPFTKGWKTLIDGKPASQIYANYSFTAVFVQAGSHDIVRRYLPFSIIAGAAITVFGLVFLLLFLSYPRGFRRIVQVQAEEV